MMPSFINDCNLTIFALAVTPAPSTVSPPVTSPVPSPATSAEVTAPEPEETRMASPAASPGMFH